MVRGVKPLGVFSWLVIVLFSSVTLGIFLLFWLPWFLLIKKYECRICGATDLLKVPPESISPSPTGGESSDALRPRGSSTIEVQ
jgi:hypothetical protein